MDAASAVNNYRKALSELTSNNKKQINQLSMMADENSRHSETIVYAIVEHIHKAPAGQKLPVMYLADSIVKNVKGNYRDEFDRCIVNMFYHAFKTGDEKVRLSLYKLRQTWNVIFTRTKMHELDLKVHELDPAWPLQGTHSSSSGATPTFKPGPSHSFNGQADVRPVLKASTSTAAERDPRLKKEEPADSSSPSTSNPNREVKKEEPYASPSSGVNTVIKTEPISQSNLNKRDQKQTREPAGDWPGMDQAPPLKIARLDHESSSALFGAVPPSAVIPGLLPSKPSFANNPFGPNRVSLLAGIDIGLPGTSGSSAIDLSPHGVGTFSFNALPASTVSPASQYRPPGSATGGQVDPYAQSAHIRPSPQQPTPPPTKHVFKNDDSRPDIPSNNRIFVDGRAYEVLYINDVAVIERDGLPHRVYFTGEPRNVVIDGKAYMLSFEKEREVPIDGIMHKIRFGAPSRELYMGDYPFKGAFGGAPIFATINGIRHEIRLAGPAPEVKIEPEPSYELSRFLAQARGPQAVQQKQQPPKAYVPPKTTPKPPAPKPLASDVTSLLSKLRQKGILNLIEKKPSPPPILAEIRESDEERASAPPPNFAKNPFDMRLLKIRYDSVVAALMDSHAVCRRCGLRFDSSFDFSRQKRHEQWHVRRNIAAATSRSKESQSCQWNNTGKEWISAKDTVEEEEAFKEVRLPKKVKPESDTDVPTTSTKEEIVKTCAVCGESFDEYFDEEEDEWKLKDCVQAGEKMCHRSCVADLHMADTETEGERATHPHKKEEPSEEEIDA